MSKLYVVFTDENDSQPLYFSDNVKAQEYYHNLKSIEYLTFIRTYREEDGIYICEGERHGGVARRLSE